MNTDKKFWLCTIGICISGILGGCATSKPYDYTAFHQHHPHSILVLPPVNDSPDVEATNSVLSQTALPLAESGYYVFPAGLVDQIFKKNGLTTANDIQAVAPAKLQEIFAADAALYINIKQYGTVYAIVGSNTVVTVEAKLIDLKTGSLLWSGSASATNNAGGDSGGGIAGLLIQAVVHQIVASMVDESHAVAGVAAYNLLAAGRPDGMLYGPRSPQYQKP